VSIAVVPGYVYIASTSSLSLFNTSAAYKPGGASEPELVFTQPMRAVFSTSALGGSSHGVAPLPSQLSLHASGGLVLLFSTFGIASTASSTASSTLLFLGSRLQYEPPAPPWWAKLALTALVLFVTAFYQFCRRWRKSKREQSADDERPLLQPQQPVSHPGARRSRSGSREGDGLRRGMEIYERSRRAQQRGETMWQHSDYDDAGSIDIDDY